MCLLNVLYLLYNEFIIFIFDYFSLKLHISLDFTFFVLIFVIRFLKATFIFTARRYPLPRSLSAVFAVAWCSSVRLSVRPFVTLVDCIQTAEDIVKLLSRPGIPIIQVF